MGELSFTFADLYGGGFTTRDTTQPEAEDQVALIDDQEAAFSNPVVSSHKSIWVSVLAVLGIIVLLNIKI